MRPSIAKLIEQLSSVLCRDQHRLRQIIQKLAQQQDDINSQAVSRVSERIQRSFAEVERRRQLVPSFNYPAELPVVANKDDIAEAIAQHQVVIVAGETGSGKTTQLPKICLELGLGQRGLIGHTQPRRLAARSVSARLCEELQTQPGEQVGYKIRFNDQVGDNTLIKLMTDGVLLAELQHDRFLSQYEVLIIDEAHERSLNIDFILGYLKHILLKRRDLKVIITSATIDPERFSKHFNDAPMLLVEGRTYPVETRYRSAIETSKEHDLNDAIDMAIDELYREQRGDILIFMNGEREIRDTADWLRRRQLPHTEILPLYARLSNAEQNKIFAPHTGRRIVLATNVAETSLTVPGIRYVIDPGTARISRYSARAKVQRLPIEAISQASANQRKGRCGRIAEGICIRLYSEDDFLSRPEFTDPEIRRTNLASVILQMAALRLGDIQSFPFIDPPDQRSINDGINLLDELGAVTPQNGNFRGIKLTSLGQQLARLPVDPRMARMVLAGGQLGCVREIMVICAALSIQDPRERPLDAKQAADLQHQRFIDKQSDFVSYLNLWDYLRGCQSELSHNQFRKLCTKEFLAYMRVREWQDIYQQLRQVAAELGLKVNQQRAEYDTIHQAMVTGLLSHLGFRDKEREFLGARNTRFVIFPGSALAKKPPKWIVSAQLVETSRLFARDAATIKPEWLETLGQHLVKVSYSEPHWSAKQGAVLAYQTKTLFGVPIVVRRLCQYGSVDPKLSRDIFIRSALVEGEWRYQPEFLKINQALLDEVEELEQKSRRRDVRIDDESLYYFYAERIPEDIVSIQHFNRWWKQAQQTDPHRLNFEKQMLMRHDAEHVTARQYPDVWQQGALTLPLSYVFEPNQIDDGVSVTIPLAMLNQIHEQGFDWQIPAFREELIIAWIKSLPKTFRRNFVPAPNYAKACMEALPLRDDEKLFVAALAHQLLRMTGVRIDDEQWDATQLPAHLRINFKVIDQGQLVAQGRELNALQQQLKGQVTEQLNETARSQKLEVKELYTWPDQALPEEISASQSGLIIKSYPALVDKTTHVDVQVFDRPERAAQNHRQGVRRLLLLNVPSPIKYLQQKLPNKTKLGLYFNPFGKIEDLLDDCIQAAVDQLVETNMIRHENEFLLAKERVRSEIADTTLAIAAEVEKILSAHYTITKKMKGRVAFDQVMAFNDVKTQLQQLVFRGFVTQAGAAKMRDIQRYLQAVTRRLEKLPIDPNKDRLAMIQIQPALDAYNGLTSKLKHHPLAQDYCDEIRWMIEELRVSLFAQQLGTAHPISAKRVCQRVDQITKELR
ncbi:ATP-dependent RNA helicase HrpA [Celerinatantimonas yamalensis]|uniref:ATP-dependent RNA helicase HrpA n=1 Tax=Celerinatantimonas yamalensis TaxID=559956 RepID=A0ABW9G3Y1_9GAMM